MDSVGSSCHLDWCCWSSWHILLPLFIWFPINHLHIVPVYQVILSRHMICDCWYVACDPGRLCSCQCSCDALHFLSMFSDSYSLRYWKYENLHSQKLHYGCFATDSMTSIIYGSPGSALSCNVAFLGFNYLLHHFFLFHNSHVFCNRLKTSLCFILLHFHLFRKKTFQWSTEDSVTICICDN